MNLSGACRPVPRPLVRNVARQHVPTPFGIGDNAPGDGGYRGRRRDGPATPLFIAQVAASR